MNYILVKKSDVGKSFDWAKQLEDGRIVLPGNYIKVLAGKQVEIVTEQQAMALIYGDSNADEEEAEAEQNKVKPDNKV